MTANELADELTKMFRGEEYNRLIHEIPDLLRQQAQEIKNLRQELALQKLSDISQEIESEPVAWISVLAIDHIGQKFTDVRVSLTKTDLADIPLYTHPIRELTDEEIMVLYEEYIETQYASESNVLGFGRAILRKASEK